MTETFFAITFDYNGLHYDGRVTPEIKHQQSFPSSFHVVLNDIFFGYLHKQNSHWQCSEQRPHDLVQLTGAFIEKAYPDAAVNLNEQT